VKIPLSQSATAVVTVVASGFVATGPMTTARQSHTATLLHDGRVLITGGGGEVTSDCGCGPVFATTEIFDPTTGTFAPTGNMAEARENHTATLLLNGKVLVTGGSADATAELYDPASGTFAITGSMTAPRVFHTATLLFNGEVLIAGGSGNSGLATAELFNPTSGTFTATGNMITPPVFHTATLLLIAGSIDKLGGQGLATAELYDPATGSFTGTASMTTPRVLQTATALSKGQVLIAGGSDNSGQHLATAEPLGFLC
jgi:hypothetical protein